MNLFIPISILTHFKTEDILASLYSLLRVEIKQQKI